MVKYFLIMLISLSCSSHQIWNEGNKIKSDKEFDKYKKLMMLDYYNYSDPKTFFKGYEDITITFMSANYGTSIYAFCYQSYNRKQRLIQINPYAWWDNALLYSKYSTMYRTRNIFFKDMSKVEYVRYRIVSFAFSYCVNTNHERPIIKRLLF